MADAPQGGGGAHAEGGHPVTLGGFDVCTPVSDVNLSNRDQSISNRVQNIDIRTVAPDSPADRDYDDPYPGGSTPTLGVPGDG
jgi:hypothetical protein